MRILLINPPHPAIGSRIPDEHLPPLGLLSIGGPLVDAGHPVQLLDAEFGPMPLPDIVRHTASFAPDAVLIGHSGSSSAHPVVSELTRLLKQAMPALTIVYGGVYPTFSWERILTEEPQIDIVVRGEGEETVVRLVDALERNDDLDAVSGLAYRRDGRPRATPPAPVPRDLDAFRIAWELIDHRRYTYWGNRRAVVVQFSRGEPLVLPHRPPGLALRNPVLPLPRPPHSPGAHPRRVPGASRNRMATGDTAGEPRDGRRNRRRSLRARRILAISGRIRGPADLRVDVPRQKRRRPIHQRAVSRSAYEPAMRSPS